jgi:glutamate synthase domain-containing protein 3
MLSGTVAKIYGHAGLPHDTIHVSLNGTAGQAFGAWLARGVTFDLEGEGNDYVACPAAASSSNRRAIPASCRKNPSSSATP